MPQRLITLVLALAVVAGLMPAAWPQSPPVQHQVDDVARPTLTVWGCHRYPQCEAFLRDFDADPDFAAALRGRFTVVIFDACEAKHRPAVQARGLRCLPTFERSDIPHQRIEGYQGKAQLLQALDIAAATPAREPSSPMAMPPAASPPAAVRSPDLTTIRQQLADLQAAAARQETTTARVQTLLTAALDRQQLTPQQFQQQLSAHNPNADELTRIRAAIAEVHARLTVAASVGGQRPTPDSTAPPAVRPAAPSGPLAASADAREPAAHPLIRFGRIALTAAELAGIVGLTYATGGVGAVAWKLGSFALSAIFRRRRRKRVQGTTPPVAMQAPDLSSPNPAGAAAFNPTNFAAYPVDRFTAAYDWSKCQMVQKYPGVVGTLETLDALMQQHLTGQAAGQPQGSTR